MNREFHDYINLTLTSLTMESGSGSQAKNIQQYIVENVGKLVTADNRNKREHYFLVQMMNQIYTKRDDWYLIDIVDVRCCDKSYAPSKMFSEFKKGRVKQCTQCGALIHTDCKYNTHHHPSDVCPYDSDIPGFAHDVSRNSDDVDVNNNTEVPIVIPPHLVKTQTLLEKFGLTKK